MSHSVKCIKEKPNSDCTDQNKAKLKRKKKKLIIKKENFSLTPRFVGPSIPIRMMRR